MRRVLPLIIAAVLAACAMPIVPERPGEIRASVYVSRGAVYNTIAELAVSQSINRHEFDVLMARMKEVDDAIELADAAAKEGMPRTQIEKLRFARQLLNALAAELSKRERKPSPRAFAPAIGQPAYM